MDLARTFPLFLLFSPSTGLFSDGPPLWLQTWPPPIPGPFTFQFHLFTESQPSTFSEKNSNWISFKEENTPTPAIFPTGAGMLGLAHLGRNTKSGQPKQATEARSLTQWDLLNHLEEYLEWSGGRNIFLKNKAVGPS